MSLIAHASALAPFRIRSFRFQWPADLLASWAFEMEGIILGWFILVATGSVLALTAFGSLQFLGTLISPLFGMAGDRLGSRKVLLLMRFTYLVIASALAVLFLAEQASPVPIFVLAAIMGLVRASDNTLRTLLIGETMPADHLMRAMSVLRTTADSARVAGALSGAAVVATLGSDSAYVAVSGAYAVCLALTLGVGTDRLRVAGMRVTPVSSLRALREGFAYIWSTPAVRAVMLLAILVNVAAFPLVSSLLAYVAKDIYGLDQTGLGWLIACFAAGGLAGSIAISIHGAKIRPARTMLVCAVVWLLLNLIFSWVAAPSLGKVILFAAGFAQSFCMIPMALILLRVTNPTLRGCVMGVRTLAVYGLPVGLLLSGPLIQWIGFTATGTLYSVLGIVLAVLIGFCWRGDLWNPASPLNLR